MSRRMLRSVACSIGLGWLSACATAPPQAPEPAASAAIEPASSGGGETTGAAQEAAAPGLVPEQVVGEWAEFWAIAGSAETQRYLFAADGSFVWRPPPGEAEATPSRAGSWTLDGTTLVLSNDAGEELERLALGACPPNREAEQLDERYRCMSIGNGAFWRRE